MSSRMGKRGFTLIELLVVIAIIAILASILFPVFAKAREKARQTTCLSQVRQISTAIQMYSQDNSGRYPSDPWTSGVSAYLGGANKMFFCPSDSANDTQQICSYGYNGNLMRLDATGINEGQVNSPVDVAVLCDCSPVRPIATASGTSSTANYIPGAGLMGDSTNASTPIGRHSKGIVVGFCDGHAKYVPADFTPADQGNAVTKGFYECIALNLVSNGGGGMPASCIGTSGGATGTYSLPSNSALTYPNGNGSGTLNIGGEYCTMPLVTAMAELWKQSGTNAGKTSLDYSIKPGFLGEQYSTPSMTLGSNFMWGCATTTAANFTSNVMATTNLPTSSDPALAYSQALGRITVTASATAVAHDVVCFIVSKNTKIMNTPTGGIQTSGAGTVTNNASSPSNGWYVVTPAVMASWFSTNQGYSANQWQAYTYGSASSTPNVVINYLAGATTGFNIGNQAQVATNDNDMVDKVANDPYGVGYISSAFLDLDRVQVVGLADAGVSGGSTPGQAYWPNSNGKYKTTLPVTYQQNTSQDLSKVSGILYPAGLCRILYVVAAGDGVNVANDCIGKALLANGDRKSVV